MTEAGLDLFRMCPLGDENRGGGVAEIVEAQGSQFSGADRGDPVVGPERAPAQRPAPFGIPNVSKLVLRGHALAIKGLAFSPDRKRLALLGGEGTIRVWALDLDDLITIVKREVT